MATRLQAIIDFVYNGGGAQSAIADTSKLSQGLAQVGKSALQMSVESAALDARTTLLSDKMRELSTAVAQNKMTVDAATAEYQKFEAKLISVPAQVEKTQSAFQKMKTGLGEAKDAWMAMATPIQSTIQTLQQVGRTAQQAYEFVAEGTQLARAEQQFTALAGSIGSTADALLGDLKTATRGTISDFDLMKSATSIMSLGLADTSEETVRLASLVGKLGWDMNQVTLTLANQSTMRLDALGLSVTDVTDRVDALKEAGYSADQAFKFAILEAGEEKVKLLGDAADTTAGKLAILEANAANFKDTAQAAFSQQLITNVNNLAGGLFESADGAASFGEQFGRAFAGFFTGGQFTAAVAQVDTLNQSTYTLATQSMPALEHQLEQERAAMIASLTAIDDRREAIESHNQTVADGIPINQANNQAVYESSDAYAELQERIGHSEYIQSNAAMIEVANDRLKEWGETIPTVTGAIYASAEAIAAHNAATGDYATMAIEAGAEGVNLNQVMYNSLDAAGGSAEALVGLALATGQLTEAQAENILKQAAMIEYAGMLGEAIANGTMSISDAVTSLADFQSGLESSNILVNDATGSVILMNDAMIGSTSAVGSLQTSLDEFNTSNAVGATQAFLDKLNSIPRTVDVQVNVHGGGAGTNYGGGGYQAPGDSGPGMAGGADFIVPPGYPNDSYPMRVQSGEHVTVTPAGQTRGGDTYNLYLTPANPDNVMQSFNYMKAISGG